MSYEVGGRPARRPPVRRIVLLSVAVVLVVCCVGAAGLGAWNFQALRGTSGPVREAADGFLRDVSAGNAGHAYDGLCPGTRDRWTRDEFVRYATGAEAVLRYTVDKVKVATKNGQPRGSVTVQLFRRSGAVQRRTLMVVRDGGTWRVCGDAPI
ncbi:hypothetical protein ACFFWC_22450 [Plantactinospora siamensis]|uniref:DUF4878 domain-containing protein n=1 Tax=Plantactinospora siamensis TaxID=555372 RepID=A0ABV6NYF9_9ACTN